MEKTTSIRLPQDLLNQVDRVAAQLSKTNLPDFGGQGTRSGAIRRAIRIGLAQLEADLGGQNANS